MALEAALNRETLGMLALTHPRHSSASQSTLLRGACRHPLLSRQEQPPCHAPCSQGDSAVLLSPPRDTLAPVPRTTSELPILRAFKHLLLDAGLRSRLLVSPMALGWAHRQLSRRLAPRGPPSQASRAPWGPVGDVGRGRRLTLSYQQRMLSWPHMQLLEEQSSMHTQYCGETAR